MSREQEREVVSCPGHAPTRVQMQFFAPSSHPTLCFNSGRPIAVSPCKISLSINAKAAPFRSNVYLKLYIQRRLSVIEEVRDDRYIYIRQSIAKLYCTFIAEQICQIFQVILPNQYVFHYKVKKQLFWVLVLGYCVRPRTASSCVCV